LFTVASQRASYYRIADEYCLFSKSSDLTTIISQVLFDEFSEAESLVEFPHQNQAAVGGDAGTLEIDLERGVEGDMREMFLQPRLPGVSD